ncbi:MAG: 5'/3'-nucleotidase SurE [Clostridia bacterium]|nr:5'/3'-nucleotidase SurE [Clostridia bacterium]
MRLIMITNDDGIDARGLKKLVQAAVNYGEVWIVAPDGQRSAASHSISLREAFDVFPYDYPVGGVKAFACTGTAADCVRVGFQNVLPRIPDVVLSGVNHGFNIGADLQYSATVGASFEAVFLGSRAIAFSEDHTSDGRITDYYLNGILGVLIDREAPDRSIFNVNFPAGAPEDCKGVLWDRPVSHFSCFRDWYKPVETLRDGGVRYLVDGEYRSTYEDGTDKCAVFNGYVSVGAVKNIS